VSNSFFSIYVHIPFCVKKCNYCAFYSVLIKDKDIVDRYINAVSREVELRSEVINKYITSYRTLYFGGGTPSVLDLGELDKLLSIFYKIKRFDELDEVTFEVNPDSIDEDKIKLLKKFGVNRISIGLQTTFDKYLRFLGRVYTFDIFIEKYKLIKTYFNNVNIDLIYGINNQTKNDFLIDIDNFVKLKPQHISSYALEIHKATPFENLICDEDMQRDFYFILKQHLEENGYIHYEISNFSIPNRQSLHNLNYWNRGNYLGFGPSAVSSIDNYRWKNVSDVLLYNFSLNNGKIKLEYDENLSFDDIMKERLILGLRKIEGIPINDEIFMYYKDRFFEMIDYFDIDNERLKIKKEYLFVSNHLLSRII